MHYTTSIAKAKENTFGKTRAAYVFDSFDRYIDIYIPLYILAFC